MSRPANCYQGCCPRILPLTFPQMETSCSYLSCKEKNKTSRNKLGPRWWKTWPPVTSIIRPIIRPEPYYTLIVIHQHSKWHTHQCPDSWQLPWQKPENPIKGLKEVLYSGSKPHPCSWTSHEYSSHSSWIPLFTLTLLWLWSIKVYIYGVSTGTGLRTWFPLFHSLTTE